MKLHFEPDLDYQLQAIEAVCDLFRGQEQCRTEFTVTMRLPDEAQMSLDVAQSDLGMGNRLTLLDDELLKNLSDIQLRGGLPPSGALTSGDFTVEMETGTGKTYVYLRTIFELNKRYGFSKFVIVVPSVAIKEGVYKTLQITEEHFKGLYAGVPFDFFLYDSAKPGPVRNFATSSNIQIMVVTVGAINKKDVNNLYKESEKTGGEKPIDLIKATRPIIIVDEPQSVDGGLEGRGKEALDAMNPLCTLRYSATHVDKHHMVFRLDAVDAYERKLVKQIEVASATVEDAHNKPFVRLVKVENKRGRISAKVELDKQTATGVQRVEVTVSDGDDLQQSADGRAIYADFRVGEINTAKGEEFMELRYPGGEVFLQPGQAHGDVDALAVQREMIRRTIKEHLDKEKHLRPLGIKVLSLFFIDAVDKYRQYDADGQPVKGVYAQIFEEEYRRAAKLPAYQSLFAEIDLAFAAEDVHNGYFSIDKKGGWTDTAENNAGNRENAERAYNLIMKEKEKLLSFGTPLKFIFSHSALKEGWDNPNVFQICTLRDIQTERERRQTIGRGLRLCVNQDGERVRGFEVNTLTVVATENYEQFAENLQKEIEKDTGIRFGIVEQHQFAAIAVTDADGHAAPLGIEQSKALWEHLKAAGHIDAKGKVQDSLKKALKNGTLALPAEFEAQKGQIAEVLRKVSGRLDIKNADERRQVPLRKGNDGKAIYLSDEFKALWDRIKHRTTYRVQFDNAKLVTDCIAALQKAPVIAKARLQWRKADISIGKAGVAATEKAGAATVVLDEADIELPDLLTDLQDRTQLTRRTIVSILTGSGRLHDFKRNPQQFIELTAETINRCKRLALVDGIKYQKLGDQHVYAQELFEKEELTGYLKNMLQDTRKSIYEHVVYDSSTERDFADGLEKNEAIKLYAKLPGWFKVPTPLGTYNPDWAVLVEEDGTQHLYFVVETKSSLFTDDLRDKESAKIECGKAHFTALGVGENPARYVVARSVDDLLTEAAKG
ncbi:type III restriction-modification system StyLTI enzyme res [Comamonas aquatica]|uniref:type III restriction-modification system endonuclease n=1 Tax=Pseudomonadota TaxID=1224 RepID=UPI0006D3EFC8|nr:MULTISPECIES: DEAD/DEAH box helicase family protein [Pseudomonadota]MDG4458297.1 DEAD/DEAH box helicase family protein [Pseudomonas aeruginosa]NJC77042.1 DEAD/DEAH box helicase family protein [Pseudomonas aeruginosa]CAB5665132.1 type III restriction-modification system StyLTI enzyme res [Comamonas aquatica]CAC9230159.1 type III restriction-modification system StyLTI enzyme res [Comamonas aquatica]HBP0498220.1 DEAD/DEAH box helicase family protein [Pseudomonas aeruginosa]